MKKSLLALAALSAFATAAQAQSSVSIYGILDVNYSSIDTTEANTVQAKDGLATSRLGFRGTEDLGGGLKAEFQLESQLDLGAGTTGSGTFNPTGSTTATAKTFNRESWVGLNSGSYGAVRLGTTDVTDTVNIDAIVSQAGNFALTASTWGNNNQKVVRYSTPTFNGISAQVGYSNGDTTSSAETTANTVTSAFVKYEAGKLGLYAGQETKKIDNTYEQDVQVLGAKYDFGFMSVGAVYTVAEATTQSTNELKQTRVSVAAPVAALGKGVKAHAVYFKDSSDADANITIAGTTATKASDGYKLALTKAFSPRTTGYVAFVDQEYSLAANSASDAKSYLVGINHKF
jgi:predicted porin